MSNPEFEQSREKYLPGGLLIAFEGLHGCGKSTQLDLLHDRLMSEQYSLTKTKEVMGTPIADQIRTMAFEPGSEAREDAIVMTLLIAASRASRVNKLIIPAMNEGGIVLTDRYEGSMLVEQQLGSGVDEGLVRMLNRHVTRGVPANITFVLDVDPGEAYARRMARLETGGTLSMWDAKEQSYHERSRQAYLELAQTEPGWIVLDGMQPQEDIANAIYGYARQLIDQRLENMHEA